LLFLRRGVVDALLEVRAHAIDYRDVTFQCIDQ
jgi:hypothetical protein